MELSVIVPVYNEELSIPEFLRRIRPILKSSVRDYEIIFCVDPSTDRTREVILQERDADPSIKMLLFSRRFGQHMAILAGLQYSRGKAVVPIDVDLQDPPELVAEMVTKWKEGYDVVLSQRRTRVGEPWIRKMVALIGHRMINRVANVDIPPNTGDYRLMSRRVVDEVNRLKECHGFFRGMVASVGFRQTVVQFDRPARFAGTTNYNPIFGSLRGGFNGIFCFSTYALSLSTHAGFLIAGFSFLLAFVYFCLKVLGCPFPLGNPTIVIIILFLGGIQLISVGILGEYIGRIYEEVKQRPRFIIDRAVGFDSQA